LYRTQSLHGSRRQHRCCKVVTSLFAPPHLFGVNVTVDALVILVAHDSSNGRSDNSFLGATKASVGRARSEVTSESLLVIALESPLVSLSSWRKKCDMLLSLRSSLFRSLPPPHLDSLGLCYGQEDVFSTL